MRSFVLLILVFFTLSCATENHYYRKSLTKADKIYLNANGTLIKNFSGKANWYRQYWTGNLLVRKNESGLVIKEVGEWRQTSKDGQELYTITNFDRFGYLVDEDILGDAGMPPTGETRCRKDTVNGQIRLICDYTNRYRNGQLKEKGKRILINDKGGKEGKWEYYTEAGILEKVITYVNDKPVN
ncbi:hypothetical protein [Chryseolinea lacunae]|uniref:Toxin-antitoxin system YwqK family antitoxin n=1 Tax=Chryseolinea lacunae TaxID=2801331 RepID=A0ABS1KYE9_9BACT|nr:hypothetical protein [Chryseolinea lacunae]MBL0744479.1 hypothetical protein [Chryseolinea lacunae]